MKVVTSETRDHIGAWTLKKLRGRKTNTNVIRPGKGIDGLHNYLERWTGTKHEFMRPAFESFGGQLQVTRQIENNLERMISKVNNEK